MINVSTQNTYSKFTRSKIMKKSTFGILATVALAFTPVAAFADNQTSFQGNANSAAAVGEHNAIIQTADQDSDQLQVDVEGYGYGYDAPDSQTSIQGNENNAAAIGEYNTIVQDADQDSYQTQVDVEGYIPSHGY